MLWKFGLLPIGPRANFKANIINIRAVYIVNLFDNIYLNSIIRSCLKIKKGSIVNQLSIYYIIKLSFYFGESVTTFVIVWLFYCTLLICFLNFIISMMPMTRRTKLKTLMTIPETKLTVFALSAATRGWKSLSAIYWVRFPLLFIEKTGSIQIWE